MARKRAGQDDFCWETIVRSDKTVYKITTKSQLDRSVYRLWKQEQDGTLTKVGEATTPKILEAKYL